MNIEKLRELCLSLPGTTEDVKWEKDLCFCVAEKMYCVSGLEGEFGASFKVLPEEFEEMISRSGIVPAPYVARHKWILVKEGGALSVKEWEHYIRQSYELVKSKLPKKMQQEIEADN